MTDRLKTGEKLAVNDRLVSANGGYTLSMQVDGNLVLYQGVPSASTAYWSTDTYGLPAPQRPTHADMQVDGHFVLYDGSGVARWSSGTWGPDFAAPFMVLQDDGNLGIYQDGTAIWASGTPTGDGKIPGHGYVRKPPPSNVLAFDTGLVDLDAGHFMRTWGTLSRDTGRCAGLTNTLTVTWLGGYQGAVCVLLCDENDAWVVGGGTHLYRYGVDGRVIGTSNRTDSWEFDIAPSEAARVRTAHVFHIWSPDSFMTVLDKWKAAGQSIETLSQNAAGIAKSVKSIFV